MRCGLVTKFGLSSTRRYEVIEAFSGDIVGSVNVHPPVAQAVK
jgi:hypothetical protein